MSYCQMWIMALQWIGFLFIGIGVYFIKEYYNNPGCQGGWTGYACLTLDDLTVVEITLFIMGSMFYFSGILSQMIITRDFFHDYISHLITVENVNEFIDANIKKSEPVMVLKFKSKLRPEEISESLHTPTPWKDESTIDTNEDGWRFYLINSKACIEFKRDAREKYEKDMKLSKMSTNFPSDLYEYDGYNFTLDPSMKRTQMLHCRKSFSILSGSYTLRVLLYIFLCLLALAPMYKSVCKQETLEVKVSVKKNIQLF